MIRWMAKRRRDLPPLLSQSQHLELGFQVSQSLTTINLIRCFVDASSEECGFRSGINFVLGGTAATRGEYPFLALLGYSVPGTESFVYLCGGTLINRRYVLTAAHCQNDGSGNAGISQVIVGEWEVGRDPDCDDGSCAKAQFFSVGPRDVVIHEGWKAEKPMDGHDIALVRLPRLVTTVFENPEVEVVVPACLPSPTLDVKSSGSLTVAGWGRARKEGASPDFFSLGVHERRPRKLVEKFVPISECEKAYQIPLRTNYICAGGTVGKQFKDNLISLAITIHYRTRLMQRRQRRTSGLQALPHGPHVRRGNRVLRHRSLRTRIPWRVH